MNWIGGARNRPRRVNIEQKKQKEFFERRKLANISKTAVPVSTPLKKNKGISRDILHLQCVRDTKRSTFPPDLSGVSHASPDVKSSGPGGRVRRRDDLFGRKIRHTTDLYRRPRNHREKLHLPNVSPCKQVSKLDLADASDVEHAELRPFRHLPSYQSTPIDGHFHTRSREQASSSQASTKKTQGCLNQAISMPALVERGHRNEVSFTRLDETMRACDFLMLPNAATGRDRNEKRVNFSHIDEYHSLSEESTSNHYSVFESFLHNTEGRHRAPQSTVNEIFGDVITSHTDFIQEHCTKPSPDIMTFPNVKKVARAKEFFQPPDFTPIKKGSPFWGPDFAVLRSPLGNITNSSRHVAIKSGFPSCDANGKESLASWLRSNKEIGFEDDVEQSLATTPGSRKVMQSENPICKEAGSFARENLNCGSSGGVIVSNDEDIPGLELLGANTWKRIKIEQRPEIEEDSTVVKSEKSSAFPWVINEKDGLRPQNDENLQMVGEEMNQLDGGDVANENTTVSDVLSEAAERLTRLEEKSGKEEILQPLMVEDYSDIAKTNSDQEKSTCSRRFTDKACSPIQAIFPKLNAEVGVQTNTVPTTPRPPGVTVETQTCFLDSDVVAAREPFVMLGERVSIEREDTRGKLCSDHSLSQSSSEDFAREEYSIKRRRSKRIKHSIQP